MFNQVKTKLSLLFTFSILCLLILFILLLYFNISHFINEKDRDEIQTFYNNEKMDFIEDLYDKEDHGMEFDPNRTVFYYVFNQDDRFIHGEETTQSLFGWIRENPLFTGESFTKKAEWKQKHFLVVKHPLVTEGYKHGFVILGKEITAEKHLIQNITWLLFALTILFSILFAFMGYYLAGQAMKPIKMAFSKQEKFVSDASHELRTPLSIFYSSIDVLIREEKENLSVYGQEVLSDLKIEAGLMNDLINNLLILARSDKNQLIMEKDYINLSKLVSSTYKRFIRKKQDHIRFEQQIEREVYLNCDENRIQQLLYILLDNAFRYTNQGRVTVSLKSENDKILLTVEDTGCGISRTDIPYIFDRFYRADLSREKGGSGLGLSIAKTIVEAHGGGISVSSIEGEGSIFTVSFKK